MGAIYGELHVDGRVYSLTFCTYGVHQATDARGRVIERVRYDKVALVLDVPSDNFLDAWAASATKHYPAAVVLFDSAGSSPVETVSLATAYCTHYREEFKHGKNGYYRAFVELTGPGGFTLKAGGPVTALISPAARDHGTPPVAPARPFVVGVDGVPRLPRITGDPPFKIKGAKNGKPGLDRVEFTRQLTGQEDGLNQLTVAEFLANRDRYNDLRQLKGDGRSPEGDPAQKEARKEALRDKAEELLNADENLTRKKALAHAQQWLDTQTALHNPDQVAGGHATVVAGLGNARVNSSIGAQWPKRIKALDLQIRQYAAGMSQHERENTFLDISLPSA